MLQAVEQKLRGVSSAVSELHNYFLSPESNEN